MLCTERLTAGYGGTVVLRDVSLAVPDSGIVALLGPNGAGKTTLLRACSGLLRPLSGTVEFGGVDMTYASARKFRSSGICHVTEGRCIFPGLTVRENLVMFEGSGACRASMEEALDVFPQLRPKLQQVAGTMSGGEQQMLALTRAYISSAKCILLDEVSMGLAPRVVDIIFQFLERLRGAGMSLLLVEQFVSKALAVADYVYILRQGSLVFAGDPGELEGADMFVRYLSGTPERAGV